VKSSMPGRILVIMISALGALTLPAPAAMAQTTPFRSQFTVQASFAPTMTPGVFAGTTSGAGHATHLGKVTLSTTELLDFTAGDGTAAIRNGLMVMVAANGNKLYWSYSGSLSAPDGNQVMLHGTFVITGGTGRFEDATGGGTFTGTASLDPAIAALSYAGTIDY